MRIHRQAIKTVLTLNKSAVGDFPLLLNELIKDYVVSLNSRSVSQLCLFIVRVVLTENISHSRRCLSIPFPRECEFSVRTCDGRAEIKL